MHSARLSGFADFVLTNHIDDQEVAQMASSSHNTHTLTGYLGGDPTTGTSARGKWTKISIADDSLGKDQDVIWVDIFARTEADGDAWQAHLRSGSYVTATGRLTVNTYERKDGTTAIGATLEFAQVTFGPRSSGSTDTPA